MPYLCHVRQVSIFSLPEEWLWCEAWCSNTTQTAAKTIDLCNNPKTKEPKLEQARRIGGSRWLEIDQAMEQLVGGEAMQSAAAPTQPEAENDKQEL